MKQNRSLTNKWVVLILAAIATMLWGSASPAIKIGYELFRISGSDTATKLLFAGVRFTLAGVLVLLFALIRYKKPLTLSKHDIRPILTLGVFQTTIQYVFFYIGLSNTTGAKTSVLSSFSVFIVVLIAPLFYKTDKLTWRKIAGCVLGLIGIVVINLDAGGFGGFQFTGEGFVLLSTISAAIAFFLSKAVSQGRNVMQVTGYQLLLGGILLTLIGLFSGGKLHFSGIASVANMGYLAFLSAVAFTLWTALLAKNPISKVTVYNLLTPLFGTVLSGLFLEEQILTINNLLAVVFVCAGIGLVNYVRKTNRNESSSPAV